MNAASVAKALSMSAIHRTAVPPRFSADVRNAYDTATWYLLRRLLLLWSYEEFRLRKPHRPRRGPGCDYCLHSSRYPGYVPGIFTNVRNSAEGPRPASLLLGALLSSFYDSALISWTYHFLRAILHSYFVLCEWFRLFIFILIGDIARVYYE